MIDLSFLVSGFLFGVLGWFTYKVYIWPYYISPLRKIPGPPSESFIFGNFIKLFAEESGEPQIRWVKKYGSILKYYGVLNKPIILVTDTKAIQDIALNQAYDYPKPSLLDALMRILGKGIGFSEGETHKRQRKMMTPAFSHNNIKEMVPTFIRVASTLKDLIEDKVNKGESRIIISPYLSKATLDVIGLVGFNYEFNSLTSKNELAEAYDTIWNFNSTPLAITITLLSTVIPFIRQIPISTNIRFNNAIKVVERISMKLYEERRQEVKDNKLVGKDLLSLLIMINQDLPIEDKMTDEELKFQIMTFLAAGHETTSVAISWALYLLAQHPDEQNLLREELVKAFPDKLNFNPTFDVINSLEYLNCIAKETLRLFPPAINIFRTNLKDTKFGDYFIPKDTIVVIPIVALNRLPSIWGPTADDFDPKRWLNPSLIKNVTNFNYLPFHTGPRSCIGNKLAMTEFKILLSMLIRNFVFQPVEGLHIKRKTDIVNKPHPHLELVVSKVEA
ncbi:cytochrome P450 [Rhizophagus diaphanus]|nr:cytochrome P450 [Rhizophagus diaphanus] [Rhizophagus sp. MUCL 43196]